VLRSACRRALVTALLLLAAALLSGCPPPAERIPWGYGRRPWGPVLRTSGDNPYLALFDGARPQEPFATWGCVVAPGGAGISPLGTHMAVAPEGPLELVIISLPLRGSVTGPGGAPWVLLPRTSVEPQFWPDVSPWSPDGRAFVYVQQGNLMYRRFGGQPRQLTTTRDVFTASISPDGKQVAYGRRDANEQDGGLWVVPVASSEARQLVPPTGDIFTACCPHWSPDGKWIAFLQAFEGGALGVVSADGTDLRQGLQPAWEPIRWLPDGKTVLFAQVVYGESGDGVRGYNVDTKQTGLIAEAERHVTYALSPDGKQALVGSWKVGSDSKVTDGKLQVYDLAALAPEGSPLKVPGSAGRCLWAPDGRQMAVLVDSTDGKGMLWYGRDGLTDMKPLAAASDAIGWARLWQPPWWRFGR
jgi:dipeptidyl aminopeptidase/acylaminoacyl peptidase